jgi:ribosomal protein L1
MNNSLNNLFNQIHYLSLQSKGENIMREVVNKQKSYITTDDGMKIVRRITKVLRPNGKYRFPVDYYDATSGAVEVTKKEMEQLRIPGYKQFV